MLAGCKVYDPSLLDFGPNIGGRGGSSGASGSGSGGGDSGGGGGADAGDITECEPNPGDDDCPEICPEICDGEDNDCDGRVDEQGAEDWCILERATARCVAGRCVVDTCETGYGNCNESPDDGCEKRLDTLDDCGACGTACERGAHVLETTCEGGVCAAGRCELGYGDCDDEAGNGCEVILNTLDNCGGCDVDCQRASCAGGFCSDEECEAGLADCDRNPDNGCETALNTSTDCVICGKGCEFENAFSSCESGSCELVDCKTGFGDCNDEKGDGCETKLDTQSDCGRCGLACSRGSCAGGACTAQQCDDGWADCDGDGSNGCETALNTLDDCGFCNAECEPIGGMPVTCERGVCEIEQCDPGFFDCDGDPLNGCESELRDSLNCGQCGEACNIPNATASCATGQCAFAECVDGWGDCNDDTGDGCETSLDTLSDCGQCGRTCQGSTATSIVACENGACVEAIQCDPGYGNCDGSPANGCEARLNTKENCGSCGTNCPFFCCLGATCTPWPCG